MEIKADWIIENIKAMHLKGNCHENARMIALGLKKAGYKVKVCTGFYINPPKEIAHSWIEYKDKILETDCRQLRQGVCDLMPDEYFAILDKKSIGHRYKVKTKWDLEKKEDVNAILSFLRIRGIQLKGVEQKK